MKPPSGAILKSVRRKETKLWWNKHYLRLVSPPSWLRLTTHDGWDLEILVSKSCCWPKLPTHTFKIQGPEVLLLLQADDCQQVLPMDQTSTSTCSTPTQHKAGNNSSSIPCIKKQSPFYAVNPQTKFLLFFQSPYRLFSQEISLMESKIFFGKSIILMKSCPWTKFHQVLLEH